ARTHAADRQWQGAQGRAARAGQDHDRAGSGDMTAMDHEPHLLEERHGHVLVLTLNRPAARNAISPEMACRLADAFARFSADHNQRVLVLTGSGSHAFCAGGDLALTLPLLTGARQPETEWDHRIVTDRSIMDRSALRN